jgi:hypothetical protein
MKMIKLLKKLFCRKKVQITENMKVHDEWYKEANKIQYKDLLKFINKLLNDYQHDYGTICHALTAGAIAAISAMDK